MTLMIKSTQFEPSFLSWTLPPLSQFFWEHRCLLSHDKTQKKKRLLLIPCVHVWDCDVFIHYFSLTRWLRYASIYCGCPLKMIIYLSGNWLAKPKTNKIVRSCRTISQVKWLISRTLYVWKGWIDKTIEMAMKCLWKYYSQPLQPKYLYGSKQLYIRD